jgi:hypothetical protein
MVVEHLDGEALDHRTQFIGSQRVIEALWQDLQRSEVIPTQNDRQMFVDRHDVRAATARLAIEEVWFDGRGWMYLGERQVPVDPPATKWMYWSMLRSHLDRRRAEWSIAQHLLEK